MLVFSSVNAQYRQIIWVFTELFGLIYGTLNGIFGTFDTIYGTLYGK